MHDIFQRFPVCGAGGLPLAFGCRTCSSVIVVEWHEQRLASHVLPIESKVLSWKASTAPGIESSGNNIVTKMNSRAARSTSGEGELKRHWRAYLPCSGSTEPTAQVHGRHQLVSST